MKHFFQTLLIFCLLAIPITAHADDTVEKENIEYFKDGSYIVSYITDEPSIENIVPFSTKSATKSKVLKYYDSNDVAKWYVKVTGTFTYGNGSSKCTKAVVTADSYSSTWKVTKKNAEKNGNSATATATANQYLQNTVIKSLTKKVTLTCSSTGKFS